VGKHTGGLIYLRTFKAANNSTWDSLILIRGRLLVHSEVKFTAAESFCVGTFRDRSRASAMPFMPTAVQHRSRNVGARDQQAGRLSAARPSLSWCGAIQVKVRLKTLHLIVRPPPGEAELEAVETGSGIKGDFALGDGWDMASFFTYGDLRIPPRRQSEFSRIFPPAIDHA
jgi:hypothetical protein